jgi:hypothetical protein
MAGARIPAQRQSAGGAVDRITDRLVGHALDRVLATAVGRVGAPGRIRFTERQLYYELCRVLRPPHLVPRRIPFTPRPAVAYERFEEALRRHGTVPGLLPPAPRGPGSRTPGAPGEPSVPDLYDYGLPRLLICQSRSVARMLLANDIHLEAACPVFAADDLPLDPRLTAQLGRVEGATVHVLHDASAAGIALTSHVRRYVHVYCDTPGVGVTSMGLVPRHAAALHLASRHLAPAEESAGGGPPGLTGLPRTLETRELDWLARGRLAEVESVPPDRLLRTVLRLLRGPRTAGHSVWTGLRELRTTGFMTWPKPRHGAGPGPERRADHDHDADPGSGPGTGPDDRSSARPGDTSGDTPGDTRTRDDEPATRNHVQG